MFSVIIVAFKMALVMGVGLTNWYIYIIENKLGQYYTGICTDVERRFNEHQTNSPKCAKALKGKGPLILKFVCQAEDHSHALKMELWIKKLTKADKVKLVNNILPSSPITNSLDLDARC